MYSHLLYWTNAFASGRSAEAKRSALLNHNSTELAAFLRALKGQPAPRKPAAHA